jgi:signal transduction histidine kinase/ligand-binding sensor domain-containing protein
VIRKKPRQRLNDHSGNTHWRLLFRWAILNAVLVSSCTSFLTRSECETPARNESARLQDARLDFLPEKIPVVEGRDIRFRRLSGTAGLSQTRVAWVVQDHLGFIWFGTQYGLNRFDGYKSKVFKHEPGRTDSLSCVYIRSLFVDHAGTLWIGCDRFLDKFEPVTETFAHYRIDTEASDRLPTPIDKIDEDRAGALWLATARGLYRFDPATGGTARYVNDPHDPTTIASTRVNSAREDREGRFWVASGEGLDEFDRQTGKVKWHAPIQLEVTQFHEDKNGVFWMITSNDPSCALAALNLKSHAITCHSIDFAAGGRRSPITVSMMIESPNGTLWLSSSAGLLKLDREHERIICYHNDPSDNESLESDNLIYLYLDREGNIWTCFQETEPNFFDEGPQVFENFTRQRGSLVGALVTSIYEDHNGILWIGSMGGLNRIDRQTGKNTVPEGTGVHNEILSILEDQSGVLVAGTFHRGLQRLDPETGESGPYVRNRKSNVDSNPIMSLIFDHKGTLWAATYGGVSRFDPATGNFIVYTPEKQNTIQYQAIREDSKGILWLGAQSGLHRFDPNSGQFKIYGHDPDDARSLSDNRVNSIHFDRSGNLWVGTQNGLDKFDPGTGTFKTFYEQDGLAGDVVSCILEDQSGLLWMSTNNGLSRFDPTSQSFRNFSAADGLPGPDLTGWGACYQSPSGEMFFGGFSGATAFYPSRIVRSSFVPRTVLTDFMLSGKSVPIGSGSPLERSITYTDSVTLSHQQNIFSIEFSALSYFNAATNRYRYRLDGLDDRWHEVGADQRTANYTTLPVGIYTFEVQGATSRGSWSEPGAELRIEILPAWYQTFLFRSICVVAFLILVWSIYLLRLTQLKHQFNMALEARVDERTRIARELHDTLLQSFNGLLLRFQAVSNLLPGRPGEAKLRVDSAIEQASAAITEGRDAVHELRTGGSMSMDLGQAMTNLGKELLSGSASEDTPELDVQVEGAQRALNPIVRDEVYRIAAEALRNAIRHARARRIEAEIRYDKEHLRLRIRDDGKGIDRSVLDKEHAPGHWGLRGMRERAKLVGGKFEVWSEIDSGTEVELSVPAVSAYAKAPASRWNEFLRIWRG